MRTFRNITATLVLAASLTLAAPASSVASHCSDNRPSCSLRDGDGGRGLGPIERVLRTVRQFVSTTLDQLTIPHP